MPSSSKLKRVPGLPLALTAAAVVYAIVLFAHQPLNDSDTLWHIAAGNWILAHGAIPRTDPFSYSFAGHPWVAHEWLSELLMAIAYRLGNWGGILILFGAAASLALGLLAIHLSRWTDQLTALVLLLLAAFCIEPMLLARPHMLALPVLEFWTAHLLIARSQQKAPPYWLLPLMTLWANLHGSFVFGLVFIVPLAWEAVIDAGANRRAAARDWGLFALGAVAASLATPHFWHGLLFPFQLMSMKQLSNISEWQPTNFRHLQPIELALIALLYVIWTRRLRPSLPRIAILLGLLFLTIQHARQQMLAGVVGTLVLAEPLGRALAQQLSATATRKLTGGRREILAFLAAVFVLTGVRLAHPATRVDEIAGALAHLPPGLSQTPVFNDYGYGGNLIFNGIRPFIDGRADMYGDSFLATYGAIMSPNETAFTNAANQYGFRWTILRPGAPLVGVLDHLPGWRRLYADRTAVVHVRVDQTP
jgi:hypothetical protein